MLSRVANVIRAAFASSKPRKGRIVERSETGFGVADMFRGDVTPARLVPILRQAANGDPQQQFELFDFMLETDEHLRSVYHTRRSALYGLPWELAPANEVGRHPKVNESRAKRAQELCAEILADIQGLDCALRELSDAIGRGVKVAEVEWDSQVPIAVHCVSDKQVIGDPMNPARVRVSLETDWKGVAPDEDPPGKWLVHRPEAIGGVGFRGALLRTACPLYCGKRFGFKAWLIFNEVFGMPITIAKYGAESDTKVREELAKVLTTLGANRGGMFPAGTEVELVEAATKGELPYERLARFADAGFSKLFLGQTLTTEIGETGGARAAAVVHDEVRRDRLEGDIADEGETIRSQLLVPLCIMKFGEDGAMHAPYFRRVIAEPKDRAATAQLLSVSVNELGARIPKSIIPDELGLPLAKDEKPEEPLPGRSSGFDPFSTGLQVNHAADCPHCTKLVANRALDDILRRRRSAASRLSSWIFAAVLASTAHVDNVVASVQDFIARRRDLPTVLEDLPDVFDRLPTQEMHELQTAYLLASKLAGIESAQARLAGRLRATGRPPRMRVAALAAIDFERIPFVEAIESLRDRLGLNPDEFELLEAEARSRAWRVAGVYDMGLLATIHQSLVKSIAEGETSRDFRLRLPAMVEARGWSGENPWHADLVHFQNFTMAHEAGRYAEYREFGAAGWRFVVNGESCPICEPLANKVFTLAQTRFYPPVHFWCDCESEVVFEDEVDAFNDEAKILNRAFDEAQQRRSAYRWNVAAYAGLEPIKLAGFPEAMHGAFRRFAQQRGLEVVAE